MLRIGILLVLVSIPIFVGSSRAVAQQGAATKELVAVMDLESIGATKAQISACSERLREELLQTNRFRLVDRSEMAKIMEEQALQQSGCTSQECMVKVGRVLGVRKLVTGRVTKVEDDLWMVSGMLLDVESAETLRVASVQHDGNFRSLLGPGMAALAVKLQMPLSAPEASVAIAAARPTPTVKPAPVLATPSTAPAAAPKVLPALPGQRLATAVFPFLHTPCRDTFTACNRFISENEFAAAAIAALNASGRVNLKASYYPGAGAATSLRADSSFEQGLWQGVFSMAPDPVAVANKGKSLGVDLVVMLSTRTDGQYSSFDLYLVDVRSGATYNHRFNVERTTYGTMDQAKLNLEFITLLQRVRSN